MLRIAVLISGRGSNLKSLQAACASGQIDAQIGLVLSDQPDAAGLTWAAQAGLDTAVVARADCATRDAQQAMISQQITEHQCDWVILAGFMRILRPEFIQNWRGHILNIHPSLLPQYPGLDTHARALADGAQEHGASVHFVDETLDGGPILAQAKLRVGKCRDADELAARVLQLEHQLYPAAIHALFTGRAQYLDGSIIGNPECTSVPFMLYDSLSPLS